MNQGSTYQVILCIMVLLGLVSCNRNREVPFPPGNSNFVRPQSRSFSFSKPEQIKWTITSPDSIKPLPVTHFNFNKIPSIPFDIGEAHPLLKPMTEADIDWNGVKDTVFNLKNLPTHKIKFKTILSGIPKIIKAGTPEFKPGTTRGIMLLGADMGMPAASRCFLQDAEGLMWIGTDKGLYRYDGQSLAIYGAEQGLMDSNVFSIVEDNQHRLWIATGLSRVFVLNRETGLVSEVIDTFCKGGIINMMKDKQGNIWMNTD